MYEVIYWGSMPLYWPLILLCAVLSGGLYAFLARRKGLGTAALLHVLFTAGIGFLLARALYASVYWYDFFMDEVGEFRGVTAFFDPTIGSVNVIGFVVGLLIAAPLAARLAKVKTAALLDASVVPAMVMYILARAIEPLTGQGYGDLMEIAVDVCWLEAALTAVLLLCCLFLQKKCRKPGTFFQYALALWCLVQILPESLRCDDVLYVLVFARVTHLGLAFTLGFTLLRLLFAGRKHLTTKAIVWDVVGLAAGLGLTIATIFALDKTNLPKLLVYAVMLIALTGLGYVICRRIHKEDVLA